MVRSLFYYAVAGSLLLAGALATIIGPAVAATKPGLEGFSPQAIAVEARPLVLDAADPDRMQFGKLEWRGGLQLTSASRFFGGLSGLAVTPDGKGLLAVSDAGLWLSAALTYEGNQLSGFATAKAGPLLGRDGTPFTDADDRDAEALSWAGDGTSLLIAFEHHHRIEVVPLAAGEPGSALRVRTVPAALRKGHPNRGIEAMTVLTSGPSKGQIIAFGERSLDKAKNLRGWLIGESGSEALSLKRMNGFDVTDATIAPDGDLIVLERRFRFSEGVKMRIRKIAASDIKPGAVLTGSVLFAADGKLGIDNMEGIAAHRGASGETVLTLISDDNFNHFLQRTIVLQFALTKAEE